MNPAALMKIMNAKNKFQANHPKFLAFIKAAFGSGIVEDTVIEISVTKPGCETLTSNIKVKQSDLELLQELQQLAK
ncbi:MAG: hypothetical protein ACI4ES_06885 [Roseburia sp.]